MGILPDPTGSGFFILLPMQEWRVCGKIYAEVKGMIQEIRISTPEDLMPLLSEQEYRPELGRNRSSYLYRGMPDTSYRMATSLSRYCKGLQKKLEPAILNNFAKYAVREDPTVTLSVWHQMIA